MYPHMDPMMTFAAERLLIGTPTNASNYTWYDDDDDEQPICSSKCENGNLLWLGIVFGLFGSIFINTGNNIQSVGLHQLQDVESEKLDEEHPEVNPSDSGVWRFGTCVFLTGSILNFAAFGLAPAAVLAPLESVQFVTNILFSKFVLANTVTQRMYAGTMLICAGTVLAVVSSIECEQERTIPRLIELYSQNRAYWVYLCFTLILGVVTHLVHKRYERALDAGMPLPGTETVLPVTYAAFSALFGTGSVVQAKCLAVLLKIALSSGAEAQRVFTHWFTYFVFFAWLFLVTVWLYRMNLALGLFDPIFIVPLLQADFIVFAVVSGGIYFREFRCFGSLQWLGFVSGIGVIIAGLFLLAPHHHSTEGESSDDDEEEDFLSKKKSVLHGAKIVPMTLPIMAEDEVFNDLFEPEEHVKPSPRTRADPALKNKPESPEVEEQPTFTAVLRMRPSMDEKQPPRLRASLDDKPKRPSMDGKPKMGKLASTGRRPSRDDLRGGPQRRPSLSSTGNMRRPSFSDLLLTSISAHQNLEEIRSMARNNPQFLERRLSLGGRRNSSLGLEDPTTEDVEAGDDAARAPRPEQLPETIPETSPIPETSLLRSMT